MSQGPQIRPYRVVAYTVLQSNYTSVILTGSSSGRLIKISYSPIKHMTSLMPIYRVNQITETRLTSVNIDGKYVFNRESLVFKLGSSYNSGSIIQPYIKCAIFLVSFVGRV